MNKVGRIFIVAALAAMLATQAAIASSRATVNACKLLSAAVASDVYWSANLTERTFTPVGGGGFRCEFTSKPAAGSVSPAFALVLTFFTSRSSAIAHQNVVLLANKGSALAGTGANEAFAHEERSAGSTSTRATWRKGRYWGWLSVAGPKLVGDRDDARDLLKAFLRRLPSS